MQISGEPIMTKESSLTVLQLKQLLVGLLEHGNGVCIRVRMLGELWQDHFMRVRSISDDRVLLNDEVKNQLRTFQISQIMQVEIDHRFREYQPHNHYQVKVDSTPVKSA